METAVIGVCCLILFLIGSVEGFVSLSFSVSQVPNALRPDV